MAELAPLLAVDDVRAAVAFYEERLGFSREFMYPESRPVFATVRYDRQRIMFESAASFAEKYGAAAAAAPRGLGVDLNLVVAGDIDAYYGRVTAAGAEVVRPIFTTSYGMRQFTVRDMNGYLLTFIKDIGDAA